MTLTDKYFQYPVDRQMCLIFDGEIKEHWRVAAERKGYSLLSRAADRQHVVLGCKTCNNATLKRINVVVNNNPDCGNCILERRETAAAQVGAKLLGPDPQGNHHYGAYQFACGHAGRRAHTRVEAAAAGGHNLGCDACTEKRHASEAADHGWTLIGPAARNNQSYREYQHLCGHRQDVSVANMRHGDVNCAGCSETWSSKPSKIYLLTFSLPTLPVIKLGYSNNPKFRLRQVQFDPDKTRGTLDRAIDIKSGHRAICLEKAMHQYIQTHRPDLIVERDLFRDHLTTTSEIYHAHGRTFISALIDAADNGWDPNLTGDWQTFTSLRDT